MEKRKVAIIFGGYSSEYGISLVSAAAVAQNLNLDKYEPILIGISQKGDWFHYTGPVEKILDDTWNNGEDCVPAAFSPSRSRPGFLCFTDQGARLCPIDVAFPVLHGKNGEDGTVQGMLSLAGIPLAGCNTLASALCMDKDRAHKLAGVWGVRVPEGLVLHAADTFHGNKQDLQIQEFVRKIGFPLFVKPVKAGSSYGISKIYDFHALGKAIATAFQYDDEVVLEETIDGFEVGCAVIGCGLSNGNSENLIVGEPDEIELSQGFFDFTEKYTLKTSAIHVPARISPAKGAEIKETAKGIYRALGCTGFARVDMFLTKDGEIVFNEVNTIPGFTEHSRFPSMMKAAGMSFQAVLDKIIEQAVER